MWLRVIGSPAGSASDAAGVSAAETAASHGGVGTLDLVLVAVEQPEHLDAGIRMAGMVKEITRIS